MLLRDRDHGHGHGHDGGGDDDVHDYGHDVPRIFQIHQNHFQFLIILEYLFLYEVHELQIQDNNDFFQIVSIS